MIPSVSLPPDSDELESDDELLTSEPNRLASRYPASTITRLFSFFLESCRRGRRFIALPIFLFRELNFTSPSSLLLSTSPSSSSSPSSSTSAIRLPRHSWSFETSRQNIINFADVALPVFVRLPSYGEATAIFAEFNRIITTMKISSGFSGRGGSFKPPLLVFRKIQTRPPPQPSTFRLRWV